MNALSVFRTTIEQVLCIEVQENSFDFVLTINLLGEVVAIQNLFLQLPSAAQALPVDKANQKMATIQNLGRFIQYMIPLEFFEINHLEGLEFFIERHKPPTTSLDRFVREEDLQSLQQKVAQKRHELGIAPDQYPPEAATSTWMKNCCQLLEKHQQNALTETEILAIKRLKLAFMRDAFFYDQLEDLKTNRINLTPELLQAFWPLVVEQRSKPPLIDWRKGLTALLDILSEYPKTEATKNWLLSIYQEKAYQLVHFLVIKLLSHYPEKAIYELVLGYAQQFDLTTIQFSSKFKYALAALTNLASFYTPAVLELARTVVNRKAEYETHYIAYSILKKGGLSEAAIMAEVKPWFNDMRHIDKAFSLICIYTYLIDDLTLLPSHEALIDFAVRLLEDPTSGPSSGADLAIEELYPLLLEKIYTPDLSDRLYELSLHGTEKIVEQSLEWSYYLLLSEKCAFMPSPLLKKRVRELRDDEGIHSKLRTSVVKWCTYFAVADRDDTVIPQFLSFIDHSSNCCLERDSILGINTILQEVGFTPAVHSTYLEMAKLEYWCCYNGQAAVIQALQLSPSPSIQREISNIKFSPEKQLPTLDSFHREKPDSNLKKFLLEISL